MKALDVVLQLASRLPMFTGQLTQNFSVVSLTRSGTTVTVTTSTPHGFLVNQGVSITGAQTPISISSLTRVVSIGTLVTATDHDITFGPNKPFTTVEISGATEAEFNGTFTITSVPNRNTINFSMPNSGATSATGTPLLLNGSSVLQDYNGNFEIASVPTTTTLTYEVADSTLFTPASGTIVARGNSRISASATFERLLSAYDEKPQPLPWLFVVLGDVISSKNRNILSDATDNAQRSNYFRQQLLQNLSLYLFIPTSSQIAARQARDLAEELFRPICQSILFEKFDSYLFSGKLNPLQFVSHGTQAYNTGFYVHQYTFQEVSDLLFEDTVGFSEDVAFRDIDMTMFLDVGTGVESLTADIDLDDELL